MKKIPVTIAIVLFLSFLLGRFLIRLQTTPDTVTLVITIIVMGGVVTGVIFLFRMFIENEKRLYPTIST